MKYENGKDIFPEQLLKQIQKYVSGKMVYIPASDQKREWGETSGYKQYLFKRNQEIKTKFDSDMEIEQLTDEYYLSCESIKKAGICSGIQMFIIISRGICKGRKDRRMGTHIFIV